LLERTKELLRERFTSQYLTPPCVHEHVEPVGGSGERTKRVSVAVDDPRSVDQKQ
jgi:hypothetical protein